MRGIYGFFHGLLAVPFRFIFNIKVTGAKNEPAREDGAYLVCSNHTSAWDPIWIAAATRRQQPHFMAKAELFKIPLLGRLIRSLGAYPVNRRIADVSSIKNAIALLKGGNCVGLFPQGTRRAGVNPLNTAVKNGAGMIALRAGAQVLPVFIGTKRFKASAFVRKNISIGSPIPYRELQDAYNKEGSYAAPSRLIFDRICALGGLYPEDIPGARSDDESDRTDKINGADRADGADKADE